MPLRLTPNVQPGDPTPDPEARFELLGVLIHASMCTSDESAIGVLRHYVEDARATMTSTTTMRMGECEIIAVADLRAGGATTTPRIAIHGISLSDTVAAAAAGRSFADILSLGWLEHPGLIIAAGEKEEGSRPITRFSILPTRLTLEEAEQAIRTTAHLRARPTPPDGDTDASAP